MDTTITREEIKEVAIDERQKLNIDSYLNCGFINRRILQRLNEEFPFINARLIEIEVTPVKDMIEGEDHCFVVIDSKYVSDESQNLFVDGGLDQFCEEYYQDRIGAVLPSKTNDGPATKDEFDSVEIFTRRERKEWFRHFSNLPNQLFSSS